MTLEIKPDTPSSGEIYRTLPLELSNNLYFNTPNMIIVASTAMKKIPTLKVTE